MFMSEAGEALKREKEETFARMKKEEEEEENKAVGTVVAQPPQKKRKRWEDIEPGAATKKADWDVPHFVIPALFPLLKHVCQSKNSWETRHTGIKIVQEIAILDGHAVLPYLRSLVEIIQHGLTDQNRKVRRITALSLAALAQAAAPYGKGSFDSVLKPLSEGIQSERGRVLYTFLKAIGFIIPLMDANYARYFTKEATLIILPEFHLHLSPDDEDIKKMVVKVLKELNV